MDVTIINNASDVPFSFIVRDLIAGNIGQSENKQAVFKKMNGAIAITLRDIEAAVTLVFRRGELTIEDGIIPKPAIVIKTAADLITDLNLLHIRWGIPYYFDAAGRRVLAHLLRRRLTIKGMLRHPVLLTRMAIIMSVT